MPSAVLPSQRLDGQHAIVTGAGRGIGRATALALAEAGADVTLFSRSPAELTAGARELREEIERRAVGAAYRRDACLAPGDLAVRADESCGRHDGVLEARRHLVDV